MFASLEDSFPLLKDMDENSSFVEFGVYHADCFNRMLRESERIEKPFKEVWGLDSFQGLCEEDPNVYQNFPEWKPGVFSVQTDYNLPDLESAVQFVKDRIIRKDVKLVVGFFSDTLTEELAKTFPKKIGYCHCDVDLFISSKQVLDFMFGHKVATPGMIIRWDDFLSTPWTGGNRRAHTEATAKYNIEWEYTKWENVFIVRNYEGMPHA